MGWRWKVARQAVLARVPFGQAVRRLKRQAFGYQPNVHNLRETLLCWQKMERCLQEAGASVKGATVMEIGTGWFPTIPILQCLGGARQVYMTDLNRHMDDVSFASTLDFLNSSLPQEPRLSAIGGVKDLPLTYLAPFRLDDIPDGSIDLVTSRTVLEHIPPVQLSQLLTDLRPKLSPDACMVHLVDHSDHLEHRDKSISKVNFLTWSDRRHAIVNWLTREGENRLRHDHYLDLFQATGYDVIAQQAEVHEPTLALLPTLPLAEPFASMPHRQLATLTSVYVLRPRGEARPS